jgi:ABC-type antimicrobial peptide transport system permease subunit
LEDLKMTGIIGVVVIGLAAFLCLVLILLSIGSLANTIMISVDKNKKFIGLLKALGLDEKDLKSTIKLESVTTILLGVVLAFLTIFAFSGFLSDLNTLIINSLFSNYVKEVDYVAVFSMPIYVPIIVLFFFIAFTLLFARGSMSKIAKTDPMAVISEVA